MLQGTTYPTIPSACYLSMFDCKLILPLIKLHFIRLIIQGQDQLESTMLQDFIHLFITKQIIVSNTFHRNLRPSSQIIDRNIL